MKKIVVAATIFITLTAGLVPTWIIERYQRFTFFYTVPEQRNKVAYLQLVDNGVHAVELFFHAYYLKKFDVFIQPNRISFDQAYQKNYHQPAFHSECWLVATGDGYRINIIAPANWDKEICMGRYTDFSNKRKTQNLITHELIHVYHGQHNIDPMLTGMNGTDWFIEGLAFYAAGQLGAEEQLAVRKAIKENKVPATLDAMALYAEVNLRYAFWGSLVRYIDQQGRVKLEALLRFNRRNDILNALGKSESELLSDWKRWTARS